MPPALPPIAAVPSPDLAQGINAFVSHNWYAAAAIVLMLVIQIVRSREMALWTKTPVGFRWAWPVGLAMVTAFVHAFVVGEALKQAGVDVLNSLWQIALPAMGGAAALKESPLPWDGGAGGAMKYASFGAAVTQPSYPPDLHLVTPENEDDRPTPIDPGVRPPPPSTPPDAA